MPRFQLFASLALCLALLGAGKAAALDASLDQAIRDSGFIFLGTIEKPGGSNLTQLPGSAQTALVRVSEVIEQPDVFRDLRGDLVTVVLADGSSAVEGEAAVFFATGSLYGENLAVSELMRLSGRYDADSIRKLVAEVRREETDEALSGRLASASAVVTGVVADVRPMRSPEEDLGEHAASWMMATLDVDTALKGEPAKALYFAQDTDNFWRKTPKLAPGEKGIFLLQPYEGRDLPRGSFVVIDVLDVQPMTELDHVRGLLR